MSGELATSQKDEALPDSASLYSPKEQCKPSFFCGNGIDTLRLMCCPLVVKKGKCL